MGVQNDLAYYRYEAAHLNVVAGPRRLRRRASDLQQSRQSADRHALRPHRFGGLRALRAHDPPLGKPAFGLGQTSVNGQRVPVTERVVWERPFGRVIAFDRALNFAHRPQPKILMVAPMSGHFATLLRGTVEAFLPPTRSASPTGPTPAWCRCRRAASTSTITSYLISMFRALGPDLHVMAVCQPSVPVMAAIARMEAEDDPRRRAR